MYIQYGRNLDIALRTSALTTRRPDMQELPYDIATTLNGLSRVLQTITSGESSVADDAIKHILADRDPPLMEHVIQTTKIPRYDSISTGLFNDKPTHLAFVALDSNMQKLCIWDLSQSDFVVRYTCEKIWCQRWIGEELLYLCQVNGEVILAFRNHTIVIPQPANEVDSIQTFLVGTSVFIVVRTNQADKITYKYALRQNRLSKCKYKFACAIDGTPCWLEEKDEVFRLRWKQQRSSWVNRGSQRFMCFITNTPYLLTAEKGDGLRVTTLDSDKNMTLSTLGARGITQNHHCIYTIQNGKTYFTNCATGDEFAVDVEFDTEYVPTVFAFGTTYVVFGQIRSKATIVTLHGHTTEVSREGDFCLRLLSPEGPLVSENRDTDLCSIHTSSANATEIVRQIPLRGISVDRMHVLQNNNIIAWSYRPGEKFGTLNILDVYSAP